MLNNKGFTLIETLFAFQVYLIIIFIVVSLTYGIKTQNKQLTQNYQTIVNKEESLSGLTEITEILDQVLR